MKWIFALNAESVAGYGDLARVAVVSARQHSSLDAVCLFDGGSDPKFARGADEFTAWLSEQEVSVVQVRSRYYDEISQIARARDQGHLLNIAGGAFLRLEIPRLARELGWTDEFVFYTDCDVMFERDPRPLLEPLRPHFFAGCPEFSKRRGIFLNTGAMWMNLRALDAAAGFETWTRRNLGRCLDFAFDQGAFRVYFNPLHRLAWRLGIANHHFYRVMGRVPLRTWKWNKLPLELNWKPYWGPNAAASLIHFHGLKPTQRAQLEAGTLAPILQAMHTPFWDQCAQKWEAFLQSARAR